MALLIIDQKQEQGKEKETECVRSTPLQSKIQDAGVWQDQLTNRIGELLCRRNGWLVQGLFPCVHDSEASPLSTILLSTPLHSTPPHPFPDINRAAPKRSRNPCPRFWGDSPCRGSRTNNVGRDHRSIVMKAIKPSVS